MAVDHHVGHAGSSLSAIRCMFRVSSLGVQTRYQKTKSSTARRYSRASRIAVDPWAKMNSAGQA
jgi:hypothetical protein